MMATIAMNQQSRIIALKHIAKGGKFKALFLDSAIAKNIDCLVLTKAS